MIIALQTAGVAVILKVREISFMGVVLLLMVVLLLAVVWTASRMADAKNKLARQLAGKADAWYIATGAVGCLFTSRRFSTSRRTGQCSSFACTLYIDHTFLLTNTLFSSQD